MASTITQTSTATPGPSTNDAIGSNALGEQQFMQLLLAQLQNQDPTQPVDNQQMVAQLATFSQLEQQTTTNTNLQTLITGQAANNQTSAVNLVGKSITYTSSTINLASTGAATTLNCNLAAPANNVTATVTDSTGKIVRTIKQNAPQAAGADAIAFNGNDDGGNPLPAGTYTVAFSAKDASGNAVTTTTTTTGICTGLTYSNGYPQPVVGNVTINMANISKIGQPTP